MFENIMSFFKKRTGTEPKKDKSKNTAKERLHLVLIQDRASVSADFLDAMKQEIIEVIKKYIEIDENAIDVKLTNQVNEDGTNGAPALYANIPITNVKVMPAKQPEQADIIEKQKETAEVIKSDSVKNKDENGKVQKANESVLAGDEEEGLEGIHAKEEKNTNLDTKIKNGKVKKENIGTPEKVHN